MADDMKNWKRDRTIAALKKDVANLTKRVKVLEEKETSSADLDLLDHLGRR